MYFTRTLWKPHHVMAMDAMNLNYKSSQNKMINIQRGPELTV